MPVVPSATFGIKGTGTLEIVHALESARCLLPPRPPMLGTSVLDPAGVQRAGMGRPSPVGVRNRACVVSRMRGTATHLTPIRRRERSRGQSTVEFVLIAPILLLLLVAIADFGRVFAAGVAVEAATRNAAEIAAEEYVKNPPGDPALTPAQRLDAPAPTSGNQAYYDDLAMKAARTVCVELRNLPNTTYDSVSGTCPSWPLIRVCVHDQTASNANNHCGQPITPGFDASPPGECTTLPPPGDASWDPTMTGGGISPGGEPSRYVEVRVCYKFTTILNLPLVPSEITFQNTRMFTIACFRDPTAAGNNGAC